MWNASIRDELINSKKDLNTQRFAFEQHLKVETSHFQSRIDSLEKHNVGEYNSGLSFCYDWIIFVLKQKYPELDMNKLEAGVNAYMDEQNKQKKVEKQRSLLRLQQMQPILVRGSPREQIWPSREDSLRLCLDCTFGHILRFKGFCFCLTYYLFLC